MKLKNPLLFLCVLCVLGGELKAQEVQTTPTVALPEKYLENVRSPLQVGEMPPDFILNRCSFDAKTTLQLSKWRDTKKHNGAVIIFWAFWCDTWKDVTRDLNAIRPQIQAMKLQVLAVAVDASQQPVARRAFETKKIWWPVVIDEQSTHSAAWGVRRVPTIFVLNKSGAIAEVYEGFPGKQTFIKTTAKALGLNVPPNPKPKK
jgi:peroxiredoxin